MLVVLDYLHIGMMILVLHGPSCDGGALAVGQSSIQGVPHLA